MSAQFEIQKNCFQGLLIGGELVRLGVELGTAEGSFSTHSQMAAAYRLKMESENELVQEFEVRLPDAECEIMDQIVLEPDHAHRLVQFRFRKPSRVMDVVSRFVVSSRPERSACLEARVVPHLARNWYHQVLVADGATAAVPFGGAETLRAKVSHKVTEGADLDLARRFGQTIYVRDEMSRGDTCRWVMHHRFLVQDPERYVVKGCHPLWNRPFPGWVQSLTPSALKRSLHLIRETRYPWLPFMSVGTVELPAGFEISLRERIGWGAEHE